MNDYLPLLIAAVCAVLLLALVLALIFSTTFRNDILGGEGEAKVLGIISVKGVAIVMLCGLFLGGLLYPLMVESSNGGSNGNANHAKVDNSATDNLKQQLAQANSEVVQLKQQLKEAQQSSGETTQIEHDLQAAQQKVTQLQQQTEHLNSQIVQLKSDHANCQTDLEKAQKQLADQEIDQQSFLFQVDIIRKDMVKFHPAIDFSWRPELKQEEALHVLEILGKLGYYKGTPERDPAQAREALIQYQKAKGILPSEEQKQGLLGRGTFLQFINDYVVMERSG